jgi:hypothetical protein
MKILSSESEPEIPFQSKYSFGAVVLELDIRNPFWSYGEYELVGHGRQTNSKCGQFSKFMGCLRTDLHNQVRWFFPDLKKDSVFVKPIYHSCDKPTCPKCFKFGWAVREASRIENRLKKASNRLGLVEHIVVSVPDRDYGLSLESLRKKCVKILRFHAFRYRNSRVASNSRLPIRWFWSPHFHILGFVGGEGYGKCRNCAFNPKVVDNWDKCKSCNGFEGLTRTLYLKEGGRSGFGYIVKVLGKRKTIGGTAWYQLNHASVRRSKNSKKSHVATWFGVCSYRKLKLINGTDVGIKHKCPICSCDLIRVRYLGVFSEHSISRRGEIMSLYGDDGQPLWEVVTGKRFEGG